MDKSNVELLRDQTKIALKFLYNAQYIDEMVFYLEIDPSDNSELKTNMDEIMNFWVLPKQVGKNFSLSEISEILTTATNEIPLWIKLYELEPKRTYKMSISKRFRKIKVVQERHADSEILPFLKEYL